MRLRTCRPSLVGLTRFGASSDGLANGGSLQSATTVGPTAVGPGWFEGSKAGVARDKSVASAESPEPNRSAGHNLLLLVDSVRLTRECTSHLLAMHLANYEIVSIAHVHEVEDLGDLRPDVALFNVRSRRIVDDALLQDIVAILSATNHAPILLLSEYSNPAEASLAVEVGVAGLFPTNCGVALLIAAIQLVAAGGQFFAPTFGRPKGYRAHEEGDAAGPRRQRME
jgi:DNA-binding NarL/FixJ family response regulator